MDIKKLDLSKNMINTFEELQVLRNFSSIEEIILKDNPFCAQYDEYSYVKAVLTVLPNLKKLDFLRVQKDDLLSFKKNYLCCPEGHDFVDQFLDHFFILYDKQRSSLRDMYHLGATLTISCHYNKNKEKYEDADLECYTSFARNLKTLSGITNSYDNMFVGCDNIMAVLCQLPPTNHDPCSFTVDLVSFNYNFAMVMVTGIFQEIGGQILGFNRTFVLVSTDGVQYFIINDKLHINQATVKQYLNAFEEVSLSNVSAVSDITSMNMQWSKKCLKDCNGDLKTALITFNELFQIDEIPKQAFDRSLFSIDSIEFNFKNKLDIAKKPLKTSISIFQSIDYTPNDFVCSKDQKSKDKEFYLISSNNRNKKIQLIDDLQKQNDTFKLARKNLDFKMKQVNDAKRAVYISNNEDKDIPRHQGIYSPNPSEKNTNLNDKYITPFEQQKVNSQKLNQTVEGLKMKNRNELVDHNFDFECYNESGNDKDFNQKNVNPRPYAKKSVPKNQNFLPKYTNISYFKNVNKSMFVKSDVNNIKVTQINQNLQTQKKFARNVKTLSTLAKAAYRKLQRRLVGTDWKKNYAVDHSNSVERYRSRTTFRLSYLAYSVYVNLVHKTRDRVGRIFNISFNDLYLIYKNFIRQPYGNSIQFENHERIQFFGVANTSVSSQANVRLFSTNSVNSILSRETKIVPVSLPSCLYGNITGSVQNSFVRTSRKKERIRQGRKRRSLFRQTERLKKLKESESNSNYKIINNEVWVQQGPLTCNKYTELYSSWSSKEKQSAKSSQSKKSEEKRRKKSYPVKYA
ncbi:uncharacterized protein LOC108743059 isoform X2 [Agrilus planipennis]|nr:uncharacterized protein LOC108743059 isoform X2 [Agrilus planipennis]